jgi:hypothetical protein
MTMQFDRCDGGGEQPPESPQPPPFETESIEEGDTSGE